MWRKKHFGIHAAKNRCILCSDPSLAVPFVQCCTVRLNGRSDYESTRKRSIRRALHRLFLSASLFARPVVCVYLVPLCLAHSRIRLRVSRITASGACNVRSRSDCISGSESIDNFFDAFPLKRIVFHTF